MILNGSRKHWICRLIGVEHPICCSKVLLNGAACDSDWKIVIRGEFGAHMDRLAWTYETLSTFLWPRSKIVTSNCGSGSQTIFQPRHYKGATGETVSGMGSINQKMFSYYINQTCALKQLLSLLNEFCVESVTRHLEMTVSTIRNGSK